MTVDRRGSDTPRWQTFIALGDSFTEGLADETGPDGRHRGWADRVAADLAGRTSDFRYGNLAVRGKLLAQVVDEQVPVALAQGPDLVSLAAGVNDTLRRSADVDVLAGTLEEAVIALRASGSDVVLFAFGDPSRRSRLMGLVRDRIGHLRQQTLGIAERHGCMVVDFWGRAVFDPDDMWDDDRLHLSPRGHAIAAAAALESLGLGDESWRTPAPLDPPRALPGRIHREARWARRHLAPWVGRRLAGRSSGDLIEPKRPVPAPMPSGGGVAPRR